MFRPKSTFEQWRIFQAVVDCGGYAQAAEALNKSQSSLNHAVAKLQQSLGVALLGVRGRKAVLTPAGEIFLKRARQLSQQDQLLAIPLVVGAVAEPLADEDADHRVHRVEEPHQEGAHLHLLGQKQAQGRHLQRHRHPGHEGHGEKRERRDPASCGQQTANS